MSVREGHENTVMCPDWKERTFRSKLEELFMEYCEMEKWKIVWYWDESFEIIPNVFETQGTERKLEKTLYDSEVFYDVQKMRKPQHAVYTPDFKVIINWELWIVEVKAFWKKSNAEWQTKAEVEHSIAYQIRKTLFLSKYEVNFLEVSTDRSWKSLSCLYYRSTWKGKSKIV